MCAAPTPKAKRLQSSKAHSTAALAASAGLLDVFPAWTEQIGIEKELAGRYEDPLGLSLPSTAEPFCDAWKRAEELLYGTPNVPMVCMKPAAEPAERKGKGSIAAPPREFDGTLYAGHESFQWLLAVIAHVLSIQKHMKKGEFLFELIYPKEKDGQLPARSPSGRYRVKLFILDSWRAVTIDDRFPVDLFGRTLLVGSRPLQLWPMLLCKAMLKVMAVYKCLDQTLPHQVAAFQMLTGWPQEDLLDPLGGTTMSAGKLFDRLEKAVGGPLAPLQDPAAVASCCLIQRSKPPRMPPRLVVLTGPSAVGRAKLVAQLINEFPDKFGVTISHTSRTPKEHEVDGRDYYFINKHQLLADARAKKFLEVARVAVHTRPCNTSVAAAAAAPPGAVSCWYGTSLATVREVAATGKMCVMSLDPQGAQALRANERIDGLFLYINTSSPALLASRQKGRPAEARSTMTKRISWAKQQMAKSTSAGLFDVVIPNTSLPEVYAALKEAISTLSPIIRNRLRGLPAYVLDYADLIPPNSVEKPFLKPVVLSGPNLGERRRLLEMLAEEFPDVFAFPRQHTTKQADEHKHHLAGDGDELKLMSDQSNHATPQDAQAAEAVADMQCRAGNLCNSSTVKAADRVDLQDSSDQKQQDGIVCKAPGGVDGSISQSDLPGPTGSTSRHALLGPPPVIMSEEDFDAAAANGEFLESHPDLFMHPLVTRKHAHSWDHVREVIKSGKLPLIELEVEGAEAVKLSKGIDSLTIFLAPPSLEVFEQRLVGWATESDEEVADRQAAAATQLAAAQANNVYDQVIENDKLDQGYKQLKAVISQHRPDLIPVSAECAASPAAPVTNVGPVLLLGLAGGGCEELAHQLLQRYPQSFAVPRKLTDRKPGKGDRELAPDLDYCKPDALAKLMASGQVVFSQPDAASGCSSAVTTEAVNAVMASGKVPLLELGAATPKQLQALKEHPAMQGAFAACVLRTAVVKASLASAGMTETIAAQHLEKAAAQAQELEAACLVQVVVRGDEPEEALAQLQEVLCVARPGAVPPLLLPVVVAGPFGSGKRAVLQKLITALPNVIGIPKTVTSKPRPAGAPTAADMEVVSVEVAQEMQAQGQFLLEETVLGHVYGVTSAAVRKLQALGKLPLLDLDRVADVAKLKSSGFQATYVYLQAPSLEKLLEQVTADVLANPPLHHDPAAAAQEIAAETAKESAAAAEQPQLFDAVVVHNPQDVLASVGKLSEVLHRHYPSVVRSSSVWGFGRPLWDISCRMHGHKPLKIMVLGPAASGKSTQCALLARKFEVPLVNAGDLLYAEVAAKTAIGLEAKSYTDGSKTVPEELLLKVLLQRLAAPDCATQGWLLDGFPHTRQQGEVLAQAGHVPDKVIMLEGPHTLLLDRVKYRRIDYNTGKVYHMAEAGALSEPVRPLKPNGGLDNEVVARLAIRHDDSSENVTTRLTVWDEQVQGLLAAYEDVLFRIPAAGNLEDISSRLQAFIQLEANAESASGSASMSPVVASWELEDLTYRVVATVKYQRRQMVQLQQLDGKLVWANLQELCSNSRCLLLAHNPSKLPIVKSAKHLDSSGVVRQHLLVVESPEPCQLLACLSVGPYQVTPPLTHSRKQVFVLAGPLAAGRRTIANLLLQEFPHRLVACVAYVLRECQQAAASSRPNSRGQLPAARFNSSGTSGFDAEALADATFSSASPSAPAEGAVGKTGLLQDVSEQEFQMLHRSNQLVGLVQHMGQTYAASQADLEAAASRGKAAVVVGPLQLADQLRRTLCGTEVVCLYLDTDAAASELNIRKEGTVDDGKARHNMQDAQHQTELLQLLLDEQQEQAQEEQLQQLAADAAFHMNTAPGTPTCGAMKSAASSASLAGGGLSTSMKAAAVVPPTSSTSGRPPSVASASGQLNGVIRPQQQSQWLQVLHNHAGQLHQCYCEAKLVLSRHCHQQTQPTSGSLLLQQCMTTLKVSPAATSTSAAPTPSCSGGQQQQVQSEQPMQQQAERLLPGLEACVSSEGGGSDIRTLLRLRATTSVASMLHLPRGKHVLQLQCSPLLLHCVTFYAAIEYALDEAARLLPSACGLHVASETGDQEALRAGSRHMLFRYLLKPSQPCTATFDLRTSSPALQACSRLLLVNHHNRALVQHVLNQPSQVPLAPTDKGYTLFCLTEPLVDVPASSWVVSVTSNRPLPPMQAVPVAKPVLLQGTYAANTKVMVARHVLCPTTPVQLALLSQLWCPADVGQPVAAAFTKCPLSYTLQLFDTAGAKEVTWGATYELLAEAAGGADGRASLPGVLLAPGRYVVVMQLLPDASRQWVDPVSGSTQPAPRWELMCLPSADEKICPITPDDSYERHFRATAEAWQQQTAAGSSHQPAAPGSRPGTGSLHANVTNSKPAAAAKDRPKLAQAALERYTAEQQTVNAAAAFVVDCASGIGGSTPGASPAGMGSANAAAHGGAPAAHGSGATAGSTRKAVAGSTKHTSGETHSRQVTPRPAADQAAAAAATPRANSNNSSSGNSRPAMAVSRQLKGSELQLTPLEQVKHIVPGTKAAAAGAACVEAKDQGLSVLTADEARARLHHLQEVAAKEAADQHTALATKDKQLAAIGALQAQQAATLVDWRQIKQAEQVAAIDQQRQLIKSLLPNRAVPSVPVMAAATSAPASTAHKQNEKSAGSRAR